jgi:hypothetical protein
MSTTDVSYTLDPEDRITAVSETWDRFALDNGGSELLAEWVLGTPLWDHVSDPTLHHLLEILFRKVRATGRPVALPCRCDSPSARREMRVEIRLLDGDRLEVSHVLLSETPRPRTAEPPPPREVVRMCSWCNRTAVGPDWLEVEEATGRLGLLQQEPPPQITHTLCPDCAAMIEETL